MKRSFGQTSRNSLLRAGRATGYLGHSLLIGALAGSQFLVGCGTDNKPTSEQAAPAAAGHLQFALVGIAPSGIAYRLRDGLFTVTDTETGYQTSISTEGDPDASYLYLDLPAGNYQVYLNPGYRVEQFNSGGDPGPATSAHPASSGLAAATTATDAAAAWPADFARPAAGPAPKLDRSNLGRRSFKHKAAASSLARSAPSPFGVDAGPAVADVDGGAPAGDPNVELLSPNPTFVTIYANAGSFVSFTFRVNGDAVTTGDGTLVIGVSFVDDQLASMCGAADDIYEPNNDLPSAALIATDASTDGFSCVDDLDVFRFASPVPSGQAFAIRLAFDGNASDIDMDVALADGTYVGGSYGVSHTETFTTISEGGDYLVAIYNLGPSSGDYTLSFDTTVTLTQSNCCGPSGLPGCTDDPVEQCVCALDSFCCDENWDSVCAMMALTECGASCGGSQDCCAAGDSPGCNEPAVNSCVCGIDPQCCYAAYDDVCVMEAAAECGAQCQPVPSSSCCEATAEPGCLEPSIEACVCGIDPSCCNNGFDQNCVNLAQGQCGASCEGAGQ